MTQTTDPIQALLFSSQDVVRGTDRIISPAREISAYEALWLKLKTTHRMAEAFKKSDHSLPSALAESLGVTEAEILDAKKRIESLMSFSKFGALFYGDFEYPQRLRVVKNPSEVLYYQGAIDLLSSRSISIVGARKASENGRKRARKLAKLLVQNDFTIMSGLAEGIDTAAHEAAFEVGGRTIAVIGTPLHISYPSSNRKLQERITKEQLLISQVPFLLTSERTPTSNKVFFPERNITMSALSEATVIVEASDTSGSLYQARAAIQQKRKLFILDSCFEKGLKWPTYYASKGAIRIRKIEDIIERLGTDRKSV